jgi:hypothetical protein
MANDKDHDALEVRVRKLEDQLSQTRAQRQPADVTPEEFQAYLKVRSALQLDPDWGCGINECQPCVLRCVQPCVVTRCIVRCDVECICGPCNFGGGGFGGFGGGGRFGGLGD